MLRKMDKIIEEALTNMIRRIEVLEEKILRLSISDKKGFHPTKQREKTDFNLATQGQLDFIKVLEKELNAPGALPYSPTNKKDAGEHIDSLLKVKKTRELIKKEKPMPRKVHEEITDGTYGSKPLTKEQIEELGEEALM